jgi:suppressor for copper-sensitivity B
LQHQPRPSLRSERATPTICDFCEWKPDRAFKVVEATGEFSYYQEKYFDEVTFVAPFAATGSVAEESLTFSGELRGQMCTDQKCTPLDGLDTTFTAVRAAASDKAPLLAVANKAFSGIVEAEVAAEQAAATPALPAAKPLSGGDWAALIGLGMLGGFLLNLMPCVLPVMGLKMMSFVQQGGSSRGRILQLNLAFTAGVMGVFLILATIVAVFSLGWGEQFTYTWFKVSLVLLVFAMALSFLGVWEIPIPGFAGGAKAHELSSQEGFAGSFFKGVFSTILATPCSGPFLGALFGFLLGQPAYVVYALFISIGLGMSLPYLAVAVSPGLMQYMPKPGAWMETFKQVMGFVLLGAVGFLFYGLGDKYQTPALLLMFAVWFGCWMIGRTPVTASVGKKAAAWTVGIAFSAVVGYFGFAVLAADSEMPWEPYSEPRLTALKEEGQTVMLDFSADWCLTCKTNLFTAIDTRKVRALVQENNVTPMLADWTDESPAIKEKLAEFQSQSIPLLVIFPADKPDEPIVLRDVVTQSQVLAALNKAGPSRKTDREAADTSAASAVAETARRPATSGPR